MKRSRARTGPRWRLTTSPGTADEVDLTSDEIDVVGVVAVGPVRLRLHGDEGQVQPTRGQIQAGPSDLADHARVVRATQAQPVAHGLGQVVGDGQVEVDPHELARPRVGQTVALEVEGPVVPVRVEQARLEVAAQDTIARRAAAAIATMAITTWRMSIDGSATGSDWSIAGFDVGVSIDRGSCRMALVCQRCSGAAHLGGIRAADVRMTRA